MSAKQTILISITLVVGLLLQACSGANGFHLRKDVRLAKVYQSIQLANAPNKAEFVSAFEAALEEAGGQIQANAKTKIIFNHFQEGKRITAYTSERKAREYLLSLKIEYLIEQSSAIQTKKTLGPYRINIDRPFLYDADFALGKIEEEKQIRERLYEEAVRLILLRLQYAKP